MIDNTQRFSTRVEDYQRYRPGYPDDLITTLTEQCHLHPGDAVADIGAGTGIFTAKLIAARLSVYGVEPNDAMREMAEQQLGVHANFNSRAGTAETTGLDYHSVKLITVAQAFHWFDPDQSKTEFKRILSPGGYLALIWNRRRITQPLQQAYEALLRQNAPDYGRVNHMDIRDEAINQFFGHNQVGKFCFKYCQSLDFEGLLGRLKSSSYCPAESSPAFGQLGQKLRGLFDEYANQGRVSFDYDTQLFLGQLSTDS